MAVASGDVFTEHVIPNSMIDMPVADVIHNDRASAWLALIVAPKKMCVLLQTLSGVASLAADGWVGQGVVLGEGKRAGRNPDGIPKCGSGLAVIR